MQKLEKFTFKLVTYYAASAGPQCGLLLGKKGACLQSLPLGSSVFSWLKASLRFTFRSIY